MQDRQKFDGKIQHDKIYSPKMPIAPKPLYSQSAAGKKQETDKSWVKSKMFTYIVKMSQYQQEGAAVEGPPAMGPSLQLCR